MRRPRRTSLLTIAAIGLAAAGFCWPGATQATHRAPAFKVARAVNIAQWLTWPRYEAGRGIAWPPYKTTPLPPSLAELQELRRAGFDTVRLPVDPAPFFVFTGARREAVYDILFAALARIRAAQLKVILDVHPNSRHPVWGQDAVAAGPGHPAFDAVAGVIADLAGRLTPADRAWVALELLNEPRLKCSGADQARWQEMAGRLVASARGANPGLTLVVSGACMSSVDGLLALDPAAWRGPNMLYTFHFYEPFSFSHQGAQFIPWPDKYLDGVPWPAGARPIDEPTALVNRQIDRASGLNLVTREAARFGALHNLKRFYASRAGRATIDKRFAAVKAWADRFGISASAIFIGEFGVIRRGADGPGAFCADRLRWLGDVRRSAERFGFAWSYFNYDGPFALVAADDDRRLDAGVLGSLGLASACPGGDQTAALGGAACACHP
jgi:endoglucanase